MDFDRARRTMIDNQIRTFDVQNQDVLEAIAAIPREMFVGLDQRSLAYSDKALTIGAGGTQRQLLIPMVLARMLQAAEVGRGNRVLDIGGATGYGAAVLAALTQERVTALEEAPFVPLAVQALAAAGIATVDCVSGDLATGSPPSAPYDLILIHGAIESEPTRLLAQLADGGRLVTVRGWARGGSVVVYTRSGDVSSSRSIFDVFAPTLAAFRHAPAFAL